MKQVPLSRGLSAYIDDADYELVSSSKWIAVPISRKAGGYYACRSVNVSGKRTTLYMHRLILGQVVGCDIDHINGNGLDNRRCNLRHATRSQNAANRQTPSRKLGFHGVHKNGLGYRAEVGGGRDKVRGPTRRSPSEAGRDYDMIARAKYGAFAFQNFAEGNDDVR